MKILILGNSSNIGNYLSHYFIKNNKHQVISLGNNHIDITIKDEVTKKIKALSPDIVIHAEEISNIDFCECNESKSYLINTIGTLNVAYTCNLLNIPIVYLSSSEVYGQGNHSPFKEIDTCEPLNVYGKCKLAGETLIRTICSKYFIIRTSWCFGGKDCFVKKVIQNSNVPIFITSDDVVNPTNLEDLGIIIERIIETDKFGVYNCASENYASKIDVVKFIFNILGVQKKVLPLPKETKEIIAPRSYYSALDPKLIENELQVSIPNWENSIKSYISTIGNLAVNL